MSDRRGFSMIEMMVAMTILGIGVAAVIYSLGGSLKAQRRVVQREAAVDLLRMKMAEYSATDRQLEAHSGGFDPPFEEYGWTVEVTPTELEGLYRLDVEVTWPGRTITRSMRAETLVPQR